ncbi:hypothetical protein P43SY_003754 [Pythium insidiosum]|uniref:Rab8 family GTPase n=1 Tax=Pythium insidiosum TaxID=114742 RepID=A0AAD5L9Z1_PYTIN|nr:hypothetical protein P43SY_003754 [Pythium insidiosum]
MADDDAAQREWELEMERAIEGRGRTRSRSILATQPEPDDEDDSGDPRFGRRGRGELEPLDTAFGPTAREKASSLDRDVDVTDGGHDPNWLNSPLSSASEGRSRARSFTAKRAMALDSPHAEAGDAMGGGGRRRSRSFSSLNRGGGAGDTEDSDEQEREDLVKRAASLSKIYLVGSAPVDVSKLQDESKIVGVKKVEVVEPTGALSSQALDALSEGLQSLSVEKSGALGTSGVANEGSELLSEAELEEKRMAEEEDKKLKNQKLTTRRTLSAKAAFFKAKMFKSAKATSSSPPPAAGTSKDSRSIASTESGAAPAPAIPVKRHKLKLLLLGDSGVGKTSLMRVFSGDEFSESMLATAGVDFKLRNIAIGDEEIALQIWDTAGQERFHRITATYYKGANGIVLVYDVSDKKSYDNVGYWMNNIRQYASPNMPAMLLVGNKIDLPNRVVGTDEGVATAKQYDVRFIETSAKTSENTNGALETIARDAFFMSLNPNVTQKTLMEKEKSLLGRRNKENCVIS